MNFGEALEALKQGKTISREGWNGKNMCIYLNYGSSDVSKEKEERPSHFDGVPSHLFVAGDIGTVTRLPNINMKAASGNTVTGWLASQTDLLSEDWGIVNN